MEQAALSACVTTELSGLPDHPGSRSVAARIMASGRKRVGMLGLRLLVSRMLIAVATGCPAGGCALAQTQAQIDDAGRRAVEKLGLQTEIPGDPEPGWLSLDLPAIPLSDAILWIGLATFAGFMLYAARDELPRLIFGRSKRSQEGGMEEIGSAGGGGAAAASMATADELSSKGYYKEAMHVLLLRAIAEMRERLGMDFARSLTSREILRRSNLPEPGKVSLRDIIARVELSYFGHYPAAASDYAACRSSFQELLELLDSCRGQP
jgi:hypothetical protein